MLSRNVWQSRGLYNGSVGTVRGLLYREHVRNPLNHTVPWSNSTIIATLNLALSLLFQMSWLSIRGQGRREVVSSSHLCLDGQLRFNQSQELTLKRAVLGIGNAEWQIGLTYVGCSRVNSWTGLAFKNSFSWERMAKINSHVGLAKINEEVNGLSPSILVSDCVVPCARMYNT